MEKPNTEVNNSSIGEKFNQIANVESKYLVLKDPTIEYSFGMGGGYQLRII